MESHTDTRAAAELAGGQGGRVRLERRAVTDLEPAGYNPREISEAALAGLSSSIDRWGLVQPIVVNSRTGRIVGGHQRARALQAQGVKETDVVVVDLDDAEEKALNLALNSGEISGTWTPAALDLLEEVRVALPELAESVRLPELEADLGRRLRPAEAHGPEGAPATDNYAEQYGVIVVCEDEADQERVYERLRGEGFNGGTESGDLFTTT